MKLFLLRRTLAVELLEPRELLAVIQVTNTNDSGAGSLRQAIIDANAQSDADEIRFGNLGAGQHAIALNSPLPKIVSPATINGTTALGYSGTPLIRIQPSGTFGSSGQGLLVGNGPLGGGGTSTGAAIVRALSITGFPQGGIRAEANADLQLYNSYIGLDLNGGAAGNSGNGIHYTGTNGDSLNRIEGNVISSNAGHGILMFDARELDIVNNKIGTNVAGTADFGNGQDGIRVQGAPSGMTTEVDITDNVISGNSMKGIELVNVVGTNTILRNKIGTNAAGNAAIPNTEKGITIFTNTTISSLSTEVTDNLISGNGSAGIELTGVDVRGTLITQNKIGVAADGSTPLGNGADGVIIINGARENYVAQNTIKSNSGAGIRVTAAGGTSTAGGVDNRFNQNSISGNGGLGIDIGVAGQNTNDPLLNFDSDNGPNDLQNHPIILSAEQQVGGGSSTNLRIRLESSLSAEFRLEVFENPTSDGEGSTFLTAANVTTSTGVIETDIPVSTTLGKYITVTATEVIAAQPFKGSTSEFSPTVQVTTGVRPKVSDVKVKSSSLGLTYDVPDGSGEQIRTINIAQPNQFSITFTEAINVSSLTGALSAPRHDAGGSLTIGSPTWDAGNNTATWSFTGGSPVFG